ncbi:hypothetical protein SDC9_57057 [bioreactor metagenome]|uniref:NAD-specific glutamate dehydrogenase n=1 Tax=bioreactor metagenome TaxID=1076179 RepID=A0A644X8Y4_9ZZZZ
MTKGRARVNRGDAARQRGPSAAPPQQASFGRRVGFLRGFLRRGGLRRSLRCRGLGRRLLRRRFLRRGRGGLCGGLLRRGLLLAALRRLRLEQRQRDLERHRLGFDILRQGGVDLAPFDIGSVATGHHLHLAALGMRAEHLERLRGGTATPRAAGELLRQNLDGAVHADGEDLFRIGQVRIGLAPFHVRPEAAEIGLDRLAVLGVRADHPRQRQEHQRALEVDRFGRPALRQAGARRFRHLFARLALLHIGAEAADAQRHRLALVMAEHLAVERCRLAVARGRERPGVAAFGVIAAADEGAARARGLQMQPALVAHRAFARVRAVGARRIEMRAENLVDLVEHLGDPQLGGLADRRREVAPEAGEHVLVIAVAGRDVVELFLEIGGEIIFDVTAEVVRQEGGDEAAGVLGNEPVLVLADIAAVDDRGQDRGIGRGPADAELFHALDQRRLGVARRGLGEVLLGGDLALLRGFALHDLRQAGAVLALVVVAALIVDLQEAVEGDDLAGGAQLDLTVGGADVDGGAFHHRGGHLAGKRALPDQFVELGLIVGDAQLLGAGRHVGRPDALVCLLRVLRLVLVHARACGHVFVAEAALDLVACGHHRLGRHVDAVGSHVGDVARLVEPLRRRHAGLGAHAVFARGLLLQGRGHEGRIGVAGGGFRLDRLHRQIARGHGLHRQFRIRRGGEIELVELLAAQNGQPRGEDLTAGRGQLGGDGPVFAGVKRLDLHLALDDEAQADRLHPAGRARAGEFPPQHRRQVEAHQIVERAPRQIGLDQRAIDLARVLHRLGDRRFGDRVEGDARHLLALQLLLERLFEVPRNRLSLAIGVGGEDQFVVGGQRIGDRLDVLFRVGPDFPFHLEIMLGIDRAILRRQVADMAEGGENRVIGAQIFVDRLGLGGRFDNDDGHDFLFNAQVQHLGAEHVGVGGGLSMTHRQAVDRRFSPAPQAAGAGAGLSQG